MRSLPAHNKNLAANPRTGWAYLPVPKAATGTITGVLRENGYRKVNTEDVDLGRYRVFTVLRHPGSRFVSAYAWATKGEWKHKDKLDVGAYLDRMAERVRSLRSSYDFWNVHLFPQWMFLRRRDGSPVPVSLLFRLYQVQDGSFWDALSRSARLRDDGEKVKRTRSHALPAWIKDAIKTRLYERPGLFSRVYQLYRPDWDLYFGSNLEGGV